MALLRWEFFPSTLAHYLGNSLRNKNLVPWDLYALMTDSIALDIYSHPLEEISTQNGPPKKNNKVIVKIIK